jgi:choline dehydrogenase-like flavoprotein
MLHEIGVPKTCFTDAERAMLVAIARAVLPAGEILPAAGERTVRKVEAYFAAMGGPAVAGYKGMLRALDTAAKLTTFRGVSSLSSERLLALLESWRHADYVRRMGVRLLTMPLKTAHFDDPVLFKALNASYDMGARVADTPRYVKERTHGAGELTADEEITCDVVVVGSGAGGAVVAKELAERGHAVVILEEGAYFTRADFNGRPMDMQRRLYRDMIETSTVGNTTIPIPVGKTVGGTTTVNNGTCYRVPERILAKWHREYGLGALGHDEMARLYERVEGIIGVAPSDASQLGAIGDIVKRGADLLGYSHAPLSRNAVGCDGKGVCVFGCPSDAKRSTNVSYVPMALRAGAELWAGAKVTRILTEGARAAGVEAQVGAHKLTVRARATVIAAGTLHTPVLLLDNKLGNASGELGKNLSIHPASVAYGFFDSPLAGPPGIPQGYAVEEFHDEGILLEGATLPVDFGVSTLPMLGKKIIETAERFDHAAMFGFMTEDSSRGRVRSRGGKPFITYVLNDQDVAKVKRAFELIARLFFAAGAKSVSVLANGFEELKNEGDLAAFRRARLSARDLDITAYHPLGTARMGLDPSTSVVGIDHQVHDCRDLYVVDGAAVPSSLAVNPQLTIMALATRAAEGLDQRLS